MGCFVYLFFCVIDCGVIPFNFYILGGVCFTFAERSLRLDVYNCIVIVFTLHVFIFE